MLGEVLVGYKETHVGLWGTYDESKFRCKYCNQDIFFAAEIDNPKCTRVDPIPLTWPEAMKYRDWAEEKYGVQFFKAMEKVYMFHGATRFDIWLTCKAQPHHYLRAAALCVLNEKGSE
jgi:hypothetical protein